MRIKRLEIQGFKSFKDKTVVHFDHNITGIVGPNGCGKSNIVDAFFWVMGEQSYKHMRGSGSDDLIFNGSSKYNPLGLAEATLTLESNYVDTVNAPSGASVKDLPVPLKSKTISITRRLYRGGEGEYFINGVPSRLRDIHELFMDTGVGAKGYSVVEQGQIGKIINSKPEERRVLVEEVAGIAKYKARKKESLRKIESAQGNLARLNDVVQEIERNLKSLERQAQKAEKYREYKKELFDREMTWGRRKDLLLRKQAEKLKKEKEEVEHRVTGLRAELQTAENRIETDRVAQLTEGKKTEELQNEVQNLSRELVQQESALELSKKRQEDLQKQHESMQEESSQLKITLEKEKGELTSKQDLLLETQKELEEARSLVSLREEEVQKIRLEADSTRQQLDVVKSELMSSISETTDLNSEIAGLKVRQESSHQQIGKLQTRLEELERKKDLVSSEIQSQGNRRLELNQKVERLRADVEAQALVVEEVANGLSETEKRREESLASVSASRSRLESLEELARAHEGLTQGPKALMNWAQENQSEKQVELLANFLQVDEGYESVVEAWLGSQVEFLVCSDISKSMDGLAELSRDQKGRASIVLGSRSNGDELARDADAIRSVLENHGFEVLKPLSELVRWREGSFPVVFREMQNALVLRSLGPLRAWLEEDGIDRVLEQLQGWDLVSLDSMVFERNGILRGGSASDQNSAASLVGRKASLEKLREQVQSSEMQLRELEQRLSSSKKLLEESKDHFEKIKNELSQSELTLASLDREMEQKFQVSKEIKTELEHLKAEKEELTQIEVQARERVEEIEAQLSEIKARSTDLDEKVKKEDVELSQKISLVREAEEHLQKCRIQDASLKERSISLEREVTSLQSYIESRHDRISDLENQMARVLSQKDSQEGNDEGVIRSIEDLNLKVAAKKEELSLLRDQLEQSSIVIDESMNQLKEFRSEIEKGTAKLNEISIEVERISSDQLHLKQNLEEKYGPGCLDQGHQQEEMSDPIITEETNSEEEKKLNEEVDLLREKIRKLGEVNTMAIEEFEELKGRHDHLVEERKDLERSIENLHQAIEHINETSKDRFKKAFEAVSHRFEHLFPVVFGGGKGQLSLIYPEGSSDILDAGIDILAQPPGKKVVNIGLLSGGEKALTAVCLIFAIFMVKPSPFCILDEVDAPLDDANIGKFNTLLKEMSKKTQFILITHNKKTMELNDTLYGVTMEEPGVSRMVSVEMN